MLFRSGELGIGCIAFSPLAQGMLTKKYLDGVPEGSRASRGGSLSERLLTPDNVVRMRALAGIAERRGQSLPQMALAWVLRDPRITAALIGARNVEQLVDSLGALDSPGFSDEELREIDRSATEGGIDLWRASSQAR